MTSIARDVQGERSPGLQGDDSPVRRKTNAAHPNTLETDSDGPPPMMRALRAGREVKPQTLSVRLARSSSNSL